MIDVLANVVAPTVAATSDLTIWPPHFDVLSLIGGTFLGAMVSVWLGYFVQQPKLRQSGSGGGTGQGFSTMWITLSNDRRLLGIKFLPTTILGKRIHDYRHFGFHIDTVTARGVGASLWDVDEDEFIASLYWRDGSEVVGHIDIPTGKSSSLIVFAQPNPPNDTYFPYKPVGNGSNDAVIPPAAGRFDRTKRFEIRINYNGRMRPLKIPVGVKRQFSGGLTWQWGRGGGLF